MLLSKSETLTLCRRIFSAYGMPAGFDEEAAQSVVWLALLGFPSLKELTDSNLAVDSIDYAIADPENSSEVKIFEGQRFGYYALMGVADWLVANGVMQGTDSKLVRVLKVQNSTFLLPLLRSRSLFGFKFDMKFSNVRVVASNGYLWLNVSSSDLLTLREEHCVDIACTWEGNNERSLQAVSDRFNSDMRLFGLNQKEKPMKRVQINETTYWELKALAADYFVPASDRSRRRGAGAEVDDND